jgi:hypothetical protein
MSNFIKGQNLGQIDQAFIQLKSRDEAEWGPSNNKRTIKKAPDGTITFEGKAEGSEKETIDTLISPEYQKAMLAATKRLEDQVSRISRIVPSGDFLQKAQGLPVKVFGK